MKTIWQDRHNALSLSRLNNIGRRRSHLMDSKEKIEALCGIIESLLLLIEDETAADCIREEMRNVMKDSPYDREDWD